MNKSIYVKPIAHGLLTYLVVFAMLATVVVGTVLFDITKVKAATTADVTVNATPEFIAIADNVTTIDFGVVAASSNTTVDTSYVGITNTSTVQTDQTIAVTTNSWSGGGGWTHSDTATAGADTAGLLANRGGTWGVGDVIVKYNSPNYIYENCVALTNYDYGLELVAPTSFSDGDEKTITVRVTAAAG